MNQQMRKSAALFFLCVLVGQHVLSVDASRARFSSSEGEDVSFLPQRRKLALALYEVGAVASTEVLLMIADGTTGMIWEKGDASTYTGLGYRMDTNSVDTSNIYDVSAVTAFPALNVANVTNWNTANVLAGGQVNNAPILAGQPFKFVFQEPVVDQTQDFIGTEAIMFEPLGVPCGTGGKTAAGTPILHTFDAAVAADAVKAFPDTTNNVVASYGAINGALRLDPSTASITYLADDTSPANVDDTMTVDLLMIPYPGLYHMCFCNLEDANGGAVTCNVAGDEVNYFIDVPNSVVQVVGFSSVSPPSVTCKVGYGCSVSIAQTAHDPTASTNVNADITSGLGPIYKLANAAGTATADFAIATPFNAVTGAWYDWILVMKDNAAACTPQGEPLLATLLDGSVGPMVGRGTYKTFDTSSAATTFHGRSALAAAAGTTLAEGDQSEVTFTMGYEHTAGTSLTQYTRHSNAPGDYKLCYCPGQYLNLATNAGCPGNGVTAFDYSAVTGITGAVTGPKLKVFNFAYTAGSMKIVGPTENAAVAADTKCEVAKDCTITIGSTTTPTGLETGDKIVLHHYTDSTPGTPDSICGNSKIDHFMHAASATKRGVTQPYADAADATSAALTFPLTTADAAGLTYTFNVPKGNRAQGYWNVCWCPNGWAGCTFASGETLDSDSTALDAIQGASTITGAGATSGQQKNVQLFSYQLGKITIAGAIPAATKVCYEGRPCSISFRTEADTDARECYDCASSSIQVVERLPLEWDSADYEGMKYWGEQAADTDARRPEFVTCGSASTYVSKLDVASTPVLVDESTLATPPADPRVYYKYTFTSPLKFGPRMTGFKSAGSESVYSLCFGKSSTTIYTPVTSSVAAQQFQIWGTFDDHYVVCPIGSGTACGGTGYDFHGVHVSNKDHIIGIADTSECHANTASTEYFFNSTVSAVADRSPAAFPLNFREFAFTGKADSTAQANFLPYKKSSFHTANDGVAAGPGMYKLCYCAGRTYSEEILDNTATGATQPIELSLPLTATPMSFWCGPDASMFTGNAGVLAVAGPNLDSKTKTAAGKSIYNVYKDHAFSLRIEGFELGNAVTDRLVIGEIGAAAGSECATFSSNARTFPGGALTTPTTVLTASAVLLDGTNALLDVVAAEPVADSTHARLTVATGVELERAYVAVGSYIKFETSAQAAGQYTTVNEHTEDGIKVFKTYGAAGAVNKLDAADNTNKDLRNQWAYKVVKVSGNVIDVDFAGKPFPNMLYHDDAATTTKVWTADTTGVNTGHNFRLSSAETFDQIEMLTVGTYHLCWTADAGATLAAQGFYYFGELRVSEQKTMVDATGASTAHMYLPLTVASKKGPVVLSFTTGSTTEVFYDDDKATAHTLTSIYETYQKDRQLRMKIVFPNTAVFEPVLAEMADGTTTNPVTTVAESAKAQALCSSYFFELYEADGFPVPSACWATVGTAGTSNRATTEIYMEFSTGNGLKANTQYQMVLNAVVKDATDMSAIKVGIWVLDDPFNTSISVIEMGEAVLSDSAASDTTNAYLAANVTVNNDATITPYAQLSETAAITLTIPTGSEDTAFAGSQEMKNGVGSMSFKLKGASTTANQAIGVGSEVHLFMYPLTQWNLNSVTASCTSFSETQLCADGNVVAATGRVSNLDKKNRIVLSFADLPSATLTPFDATVQHTITLSGLNAPAGGLWLSAPLYPAMVVTGGDLVANRTAFGGIDYTNSKKIWSQPSLVSASVAEYRALNVGYLAAVDDNNNAYFRSETATANVNQLYVKMQLGAGLVGAATTKISITLPKATDGTWAYECVSGSSVVPNVLSYAAQKDQAGKAVKAPFNTGTVYQVANQESATNKHICEIVLGTGVYLPYNSQLLLKLTVNNPKKPVAVAEADNKWSVQVTQAGGLFPTATALPTTVSTSLVFTDDSADHRFAKNVAVWGKVTNAMISPKITFAKALGNAVTIYFTPESSTRSTDATGAVVKSGGLEISSPPGFVWRRPVSKAGSTVLEARDILPADRSNRVTYLPPIDVVKKVAPGNATTHGESLFIGFKNGHQLVGGKTYAMTIPIVNSGADYDVTEFWNITTYGKSCFTKKGAAAACDAIDGVEKSGNYGAVLDKAATEFGVYEKEATTFDVMVQNNQPSSANADALTNAIMCFQFPVAMPSTTTVKINAPAGYVFGAALEAASNWTSTNAPVFYAKRTWNTWTPTTVFSTNTVTITNTAAGAFNVTGVTKAYCLGATVTVPDYTPSMAAAPSANAWYLTAVDGASRNFTSVISPAPRVQRLSNVGVTGATALKGAANRLSFAVETVTPVPAGGCLSVTFPTAVTGYRFAPAAACGLKLEDSDFYNGEVDVETALTCTVTKATAADEIDTVTLVVKEGQTLAPGAYKFSMDVTNPAEGVTAAAVAATAVGSMFKVESIKVCGAEAPVALDVMAETNGFMIAAPLSSAEVVASALVTGRDDKPGALNTIALSFGLGDATVSAGLMTVMLPLGFKVKDACLSEINLHSPFGFVNETVPLTDGAYTPFPAAITASSCMTQTVNGVKSRNTIIVQLSGVAEFATAVIAKYAFTIKAENPMEQPDMDKFSMSIDDLAADFTGITINDFVESEMKPTNTATGSLSLLQFSLTARNDVLGGEGAAIKFSVPASFGLADPCEFAMLSIGATEYSVEAVNKTLGLAAYWPTRVNVTEPADILCHSKAGLVEFVINSNDTVIYNNTAIEAVFGVTNPVVLDDVKSIFGVWTCNPTAAGSFCDVDDFAAYLAAPHAVDYSEFEGFIVTEDMPVTLTAPESLIGMSSFVANLTMSVTTKPVEGDVITLTAPTTFDICIDIASVELPAHLGSAACPDAEKLYMATFVVQIDPATNDTNISDAFQVNVTGMNPRAPVEPESANNWLISYSRGEEELFSNVVIGWEIVPQLEQTSVSYVVSETSSFVAAGSSSITVKFCPIQEASVLKVTSPSGFSFDAATSPDSDEVVGSGTSVTISALTIDPAAAACSTIQIDGVVNPTATGLASYFDLATYDEEMEPKDVKSEIAGFVVSGAATVAATGAVSATHFLGVAGKIHFALTSVALGAEAGSYLVVIPPAGFSVTGIEAGAGFPAVVSTPESLADGVVGFQLQDALAAGSSGAAFTLDTTSPSTTIDNTMVWHFMVATRSVGTATVLAVKGLPDFVITNYATLTNGELTSVVGLFVGKLTGTATTTSTSVGATNVVWTLAVTLGVPVGAGALSVAVTAPTGLTFVANCADPSMSLFTCAGTGNKATLTLPETNTLQSSFSLALVLNHPKAPASSNDWSIALMEDSVATQTGTIEGKALTSMFVEVSYLPVPEQRSDITFLITPTADGDSLNFATIPTGFELDFAAPANVSALGPDAVWDAETNSVVNATVTANVAVAISGFVTLPADVTGGDVKFGLEIVASGEVVSADYSVATIAALPEFVTGVNGPFFSSTAANTSTTISFEVVIGADLTITAESKLTITLPSTFALDAETCEPSITGVVLAEETETSPAATCADGQVVVIPKPDQVVAAGKIVLSFVATTPVDVTVPATFTLEFVPHIPYVMSFVLPSINDASAPPPATKASSAATSGISSLTALILASIFLFFKH